VIAARRRPAFTSQGALLSAKGNREMLQSIHIAGHATFTVDGQCLEHCKQINFIFGTNGSGKTTISRVIADPDCGFRPLRTGIPIEGGQ
jgi:ABC-type Fe3+/spermidine/putrescine transport system ATPase subunit